MTISQDSITVYPGDLPADHPYLSSSFSNALAVDCEAMGLRIGRDRLCLVQLSSGQKEAVLVQIAPHQTCAPHLKQVLENKNIQKIFHYGRFDVALLYHALGITTAPVVCTKIASKIVRTYTDKHSLKELCHAFLGMEISKEEQTSDWGAPVLTDAQKRYAATDVLYLHALWAKLEALLIREEKKHLAQAYYDFLPLLAKMDQMGYDGSAIFQH